MKRRALVLALLAASLPARAADAWATLGDGVAVLFRHARAPGIGDPPGFTLERCETQRNLDDQGREQARRIGAAFRERRVPVGVVLSSQWCRARDTAELAFGQVPRAEPAFNSFFASPDASAAQTAAARRLLEAWRGPGVMVVTTHDVNIRALTGQSAASGEGIVVRVRDGQLQVLGRLMP